MSAIRTNPIFAIAAGSLIVFSLVGIGVMTGVIPSSRSQTTEPVQAASATTRESDKAATREAPAPKAAAVQHKRTSEPVRTASARPAPAPQVCTTCGTVSGIQVIEEKGEASGLGAIAGGVVGGLLGNQVGGGDGRKLATVAGAAGGAYAGHQIEKTVKAKKHYEVTVRMDDGGMRHFSYDAPPAFQTGDKVKVIEGKLVM